MNYIDFVVTKVINKPYESFNKWFILVYATSHGVDSYQTLMFDTKEECESINIGYKFIA